MNSKLIAIIAVVAMCGAALVGVGYAYTASFESGETDITAGDSKYVLLSEGTTGFATATTSWNAGVIEYDTVKTTNGYTYTPVDGQEDATLKTGSYGIVIDFNKTSDDVILSVKADINDVDYNGTTKGNVEFGSIGISLAGTVTGVTDNGDGTISVNQSKCNLTEGKLTLQVNLVCDVTYNAIEDSATGPAIQSVEDVTVTFVATSTTLSDA